MDSVTASETRYRMPLGSMAPILGVEILFLVGVGTGIGGSQKSNAKNALPPPSLGLNITLGIAAFLLLLAIARTVRLSVVFRPDYLQINNFWRTRRLAWADIIDVAPPRFGHYRLAGIRVTARNGHVIGASAFIQGRLDPSSRGEQVTAQIKERIAATTEGKDPART
jgi:Bacterial PH domain